MIWGWWDVLGVREVSPTREEAGAENFMPLRPWPAQQGACLSVASEHRSCGTEGPLGKADLFKAKEWELLENGGSCHQLGLCMFKGGLRRDSLCFILRHESNCTLHDATTSRQTPHHNTRLMPLPSQDTRIRVRGGNGDLALWVLAILPGLWSCLEHLLWFCLSDSTATGLSFHICKMETTAVPTSQELTGVKQFKSCLADSRW